MREIKFRAWDKEIKKMFFGRPGDDRWYSKTGFLDVSMGGLIDCELMQFTGLSDKQGVEIYEGDIIKANLPYGKLFVVNWVNTRGAFMLAGATEQDFAAYDREGYKLNAGKKEIVGNIYQNPELLNNKDK